MTRLLHLVLTVLAVYATSHAAERPWQLVDIDGKQHAPFEKKETRALVLLFITSDCPVANYYQPEIQRLSETFSPQGIAFALVHPDPLVDRAAAAAHRKEYKIQVPIVLDHQHTLVTRTKATITPEAVVVLPNGNTAYQGRIDNRFVKLGRKRQVVTSRELRDALHAIVENKAIETTQTKAIGCIIADMK